MDKRKLSLELFKKSGIKQIPINWNTWKRAFDLGTQYPCYTCEETGGMPILEKFLKLFGYKIK